MTLYNFVLYLPEMFAKKYDVDLFELMKQTKLNIKKGLKGSVIVYGISNYDAAKLKNMLPPEYEMRSFLEFDEYIDCPQNRKRFGIKDEE